MKTGNSTVICQCEKHNYIRYFNSGAGFVRWYIHLSSGAVHERAERGMLRTGFDETYCFSSVVHSVEITGGKNNGWVGNVQVYDINGDETSFVCTEGCARVSGTVSGTAIAVSGGFAIGGGMNDVRNCYKIKYKKNLITFEK